MGYGTLRFITELTTEPSPGLYSNNMDILLSMLFFAYKYAWLSFGICVVFILLAMSYEALELDRWDETCVS